MIDVKEIATLAREGISIEGRITEIEHPDLPEGSGVAVPVVLVDTRDGDTVTTTVKLAKDIIAELDARSDGPRRASGTSTLQDEKSFCQFVNRFKDQAHSIIYADVHRMSFVAVLNDNADNETGWRDWRVAYACPRSQEWQVWTANDGKEMKQDAFADFLEARLEDMVAAEGMPKPVDVLTVARQLHIRTKGEFRREVNPTTGDFVFINKSETDTGSTVIPRAFSIGIPVFEGGERYQVEARVRFTCGEAGPRFSYTLHRRIEVERDAFNGVRGVVEVATGLPVFSGTP